MKTAISIPDNVYNDAEITAKELGLARSQLYVLAIKEFIEHHSKDRITEKLNCLFSKENNIEDTNELGLESLRKATEYDSW
ncbi:ChpI protein [Thiospirochaeta perfilievii]|uniref:ChpI protein n=1 Tax=Thiospirochaeta perfilievii TaxID=252967 RepID=A0A5C1Q5V2_9SPIO|nr:ChpI protein [Thiospirochaeta perfilievii]QEN03345.1 ChpI protein [Thiospirochaeta perfilievii]